MLEGRTSLEREAVNTGKKGRAEENSIEPTTTIMMKKRRGEGQQGSRTCCTLVTWRR